MPSRGRGKKAYHQALRKAEAEGTVKYRGQILTAAALGGALRESQDVANQKTQLRTSAPKSVKILSWNAGAVTTAIWEELLAALSSPQYSSVQVVLLQETHWRTTQEFSSQGWHVINSGNADEVSSGVAIMIRSDLARGTDLRYNVVVPGRVLHVRVKGKHTDMDLISCYQYVWRSGSTLHENQTHRASLLSSLHQYAKGLPKGNNLILAGDFRV